MSQTLENRHHPRVPVQWPVVYYTPEFFGHGTVVNVSPLAWRIQGSMPFRAGMHLGVRVWPQQSTYLEIEEATVLWASGEQFVIEIDRVRPEDEPAMLKLQEQTIGLSPKAHLAKHGGQREVLAMSRLDGDSSAIDRRHPHHEAEKLLGKRSSLQGVGVNHDDQ